jgi:uncharacterized protein YbgA (DUF1722 family)/uncharacterized protein YbbK (DUF523 family)
MAAIKIGISGCVAGDAVRFNGEQAKMPTFLKNMLADIELLPFCPEVAAGMSVPRETVRLVTHDSHQMLLGNRSGKDYYADVYDVSTNYIDVLRDKKLSGYILKSKSPTCGWQSAKVYDQENNVLNKQAGIFTQVLQQNFNIPVIEAEMLNSPEMADRFLHRVMLVEAFRELPEHELCKRDLTEMYARYKLLLMAYSPAHYRLAGKLLGNMAGDLQKVKKELFNIIYDGFDCLSHRKRQTNALMHIQGYFKQFLSKDEKQELSQVIDKYYRGIFPLSVPLALLSHHLLKFPNKYLQSQRFFNPYNENYGLRNFL